MFYNISGIDGIKAMILHGVLDYMCTLVAMGFPKDEILWRAMAWIKFCGAKHMIRNIRRKFADDKNALEFIRESDWSAWTKIFAPEKFLDSLSVGDIEKQVLMKIGKEIPESTIELVKDLLIKAYTKKFIERIPEVKLCPLNETLMAVQEVLTFTEKNIDSILQSLKQDSYCKRKYHYLA